MRCFGTFGPVYPDINYVVSRKDELADYINRVKQGRYMFSLHHDRQEKLLYSATRLMPLKQKETHIYLSILILKDMLILTLIDFILLYAEKYVDKLHTHCRNASRIHLMIC